MKHICPLLQTPKHCSKMNLDTAVNLQLGYRQIQQLILATTQCMLGSMDRTSPMGGRSHKSLLEGIGPSLVPSSCHMGVSIIICFCSRQHPSHTGIFLLSYDMNDTLLLCTKMCEPQHISIKLKHKEKAI